MNTYAAFRETGANAFRLGRSKLAVPHFVGLVEAEDERSAVMKITLRCSTLDLERGVRLRVVLLGDGERFEARYRHPEALEKGFEADTGPVDLVLVDGKGLGGVRR